MLAKSRVDALYGEVGHIDYLINRDEKLMKGIDVTIQKVDTKFGFLVVFKNHPNGISIINSFDENIETVFK